MSDIKELQARALDIRRHFEEYEKKRNGQPWSNKDIAMGFVVDVGELMEIITAKEGLRDFENVDGKLAHELSDCLWSVFVLAHKWGRYRERVSQHNERARSPSRWSQP